MEIPNRLKKFPLWRNKYPFFYTLLVENGIPQFKQQDRQKQIIASRFGLCHLCGEPLGNPLYFILATPDIEAKMTATNGPMHLECAQYAISICPFLANPNYQSNSIKEIQLGVKGLKQLRSLGIEPEIARSRTALCAAREYSADIRGQFIIFRVKEWLLIDYDAVPNLSE